MDSPLEGDGFEPSVPHKKRPFLPTCGYRKSHPGWRRCRDGLSSLWDDRPREAARRIARRSVQIACGSRSRDGISPASACCLEAVGASEAQAARCRSPDLRLALSAVPFRARSRGCLQACDAGALASERLPSILALQSRRRVGRPAVPADIRALIRTISRDNPLWGAPRIHGELLKPGIDIAQSTVAKYMSRCHGPRSPGWQAFLRNPAHIAGIDLFVV